MIVTAKHPEDVEVYATETIRAVKSWVESWANLGQCENESDLNNEPQEK